MTDLVASDDSKKPTALVVDDDQSMGRSISRVLSAKDSFEVTLMSEAGIANLIGRSLRLTGLPDGNR